MGNQSFIGLFSSFKKKRIGNVNRFFVLRLQFYKIAVRNNRNCRSLSAQHISIIQNIVTVTLAIADRSEGLPFFFHCFHIFLIFSFFFFFFFFFFLFFFIFFIFSFFFIFQFFFVFFFFHFFHFSVPRPPWAPSLSPLPGPLQKHRFFSIKTKF